MLAHDRAIVFNVRVCSTELLEYDIKFKFRQTALIICNKFTSVIL
jgi:hypothetical protein